MALLEFLIGLAIVMGLLMFSPLLAALFAVAVVLFLVGALLLTIVVALWPLWLALFTGARLLRLL